MHHCHIFTFYIIMKDRHGQCRMPPRGLSQSDWEGERVPKGTKKGNSNELPFFCAQNRTRTDTDVTPLAPEASASTDFAIWALVYLFQDKSKTFLQNSISFYTNPFIRSYERFTILEICLCVAAYSYLNFLAITNLLFTSISDNDLP